MAEPAAKTSLAALRTAADSGPVVTASFTDSAGWALIQRVANALAQSTLVPQQFQANIPNCIIALEMAQRIGASPLMVCQNLYVVHGRPGWSAKFLIASFNQCGRFTALRYEWQGTRGKDDWGCRAWATEKATGEKIVGPLITIALAKAEKWYDKAGSKWQTIPELMLTYRAAAWMINTHAPEISMGLNTAEEIGDVFDAQAGASGEFTVTTEALREAAVVVDQPLEPKAEAPQDAPVNLDFENTLVRIDRAKNADKAAEILDLCRDQPWYDKASEAFKARWVTPE